MAVLILQYSVGCVKLALANRLCTLVESASDTLRFLIVRTRNTPLFELRRSKFASSSVGDPY